MSDQPSIAAMLDDVRALIVAARERGEHPRYLALDDEPYAAVEACKGADRKHGVPVMMLGLEVVHATEPRATPRVF